MSPEQARGDDVDMSADTWALCVVLYEAIAGKPPFFGRNYNVIIQNILTKELAAWPDFGQGSDDLFLIIKKGLEKNRFDRWRTSKALGRALADWLMERGILDDVTGQSLRAAWGDRSTARLRLAPEPRRARLGSAALLGFALVLAAVAGMVLSTLGNRATPSSRPVAPAQRIFAVSGAQPSPVVSVRGPEPAKAAETAEPPPSAISSTQPRLPERRIPSRSSIKHAPATTRSSAAPPSTAPAAEPFRNPFD